MVRGLADRRYLAEQALLQLRRAQARNLVCLYVAFGGGGDGKAQVSDQSFTPDESTDIVNRFLSSIARGIELLRRSRPAVVMLAVAGCVATPEYAFVCPDGAVLHARYSGDSVALRLPRGDATLPVARSASGARYANDTLEFWEHAGEVRLSLRDSVRHEGCRLAR
jgi:membrane-bound inhibitor of C-type lysozyme